jgi:hypothetical protein
MIRELETLLPGFPGPDNQTRCFAHIINLVAKSLLQHFDAKKKARRADAGNRIEGEITELAEGIDMEEMETRIQNLKQNADVQDDDVDGWVDEVELMSEQQREMLNGNVQPVRLVLVKVSPYIIRVSIKK